MTDPKPSTKGGTRNLGAPSAPGPASIQPATSRTPTQPTDVRIAGTKPSPANTKPTSDASKPDSYGAPCAQTGCPGAILDGYCDICGSPAAPTIEPAAPTKPSQPRAAEAAATTKPGPANTHTAAASLKPHPAFTQPATPIKPAQPGTAQTAVPTKLSPASAATAAAPSELSLSSARVPVPSSPSPAHAEPPATPARRRRVLPIVLISVAATLAAVVAVAGIFVNQVERSLTQNLDREDLMPTDSASHPTKEAEAADALNFVVMGYDSRDPSVVRSGSLMILHLSAKRDQAYFISIPRDAWVSIPGHGNHKIKAAYGFGGSKLAVSTVEKLTDTRMDHVAMVDLQGFAKLTDEVGGVTVYNKTAFTSQGFHYPTGKITLSGDRAIRYVGERRALPRGDFDRATNERNLVRAIVAKTLSGKIITDPGRLFSVVSGAAEHLTVDKGLTNAKIRSTVLSLRLTDKDVHLMKAPVSGKATRSGQRVDVVDKAKLAELGTALREDRVNEYVAKYPQG